MNIPSPLMGEGFGRELSRTVGERVVKKFFLFLIFVLLVLALYFLTPARHYLSPDGFAQLEQWIRTQGLWGPIVFGMIYIAACIFALPGSVLTLGGGLLFGALWGTLINWISASIGAALSFLIARYLGRDWMARFLRKIPKLENPGFYSVLFLRLVPLFPFNGLNFGLGLTAISFQRYLLATVIGILPGSFVYTSLGAAGRTIRLSDPQTWLDIKVWGPFVLVLLLSLLPKFFRKKSGTPP